MGVEPSASGGAVRLPTLRSGSSFPGASPSSSYSSFYSDGSRDRGGEGEEGEDEPWGGSGAYGGGVGAGGHTSVGGGVRAGVMDEALEEAVQAIEAIVLPLQQPVELLPRAVSVLEAQVGAGGRGVWVMCTSATPCLCQPLFKCILVCNCRRSGTACSFCAATPTLPLEICESVTDGPPAWLPQVALNQRTP